MNAQALGAALLALGIWAKVDSNIYTVLTFMPNISWIRCVELAASFARADLIMFSLIGQRLLLYQLRCWRFYSTNETSTSLTSHSSVLPFTVRSRLQWALSSFWSASAAASAPGARSACSYSSYAMLARRLHLLDYSFTRLTLKVKFCTLFAQYETLMFLLVVAELCALVALIFLGAGVCA